MKPIFSRVILALCLIISSLETTIAWEKEEHRIVADRAFAAALVECSGSIHDSLIFILARGSSIRLEKTLWKGKTFGEISAWFSGNDTSYSRFHQRGRTILQQLQPLSASLIDAGWREHSGRSSVGDYTATNRWPAVYSAEQSDQNVIVNYLLHHSIALRFAKLAGQEENREALRLALIYEAMAQSYLSDAFSAGHLMVPLNDVFYGLHPINNKEAHNFFRSEGVYVINSQGNVWQTFGDKLLQWHASTYRHVLEACTTSLRELFLVFYILNENEEIPDKLKKWGQSISDGISLEEMVQGWITMQDGQKYYSITKMPTLLFLPMPISATWSVRTEKVDDQGIHQRKHYPQLREQGFHDPDLHGIDPEFIYPRSAVPDWMIPELLLERNTEELIKYHPEYASVRYIQNRNFPPSYKGLFFHLGGGMIFKKNGSGFGSLVGLGYGLADDLLVINKVSVDLALMPSLDEVRRLLIMPSLGFGFKLPTPFNLWEAYRLEIGYAFGLRSPFKEDGLKLAVGIESPTIPLGFTYAGLTIRLMYQRFYLERIKQGILLEFIIH
jgi:hypothetical protein